MIETVEADCVIRRQYKRPMPKPIVTFSLAKEFNESVAMDIKYHSSKLVLHLIDYATRFSAAGIVHSKNRDVIICNNKKRSHTQLDSRKQVIAFQDRVITINIKEAQHPLK